MQYIYKISNIFNEKVYIGRTNNFERRIKEHFSDYKNRHGYHPKLHNAFDKYGIENFIFEIIFQEDISIEDICLKEDYYRNYYNAFYDGYCSMNSSDGQPEGEENCNNKLSKENVLKIIEKLKNTNDTIKNIAEEFEISMQTISDINRGNTWNFDNEEYPIRKTKQGMKKKVLQYDMNGNLINIFNSQSEASKLTGISNKRISEVCNGNKNNAGGFNWKFA